MLDVASIGVGVLFFIGCELYIHFCDKLWQVSQVKGGEE
jgi:hypothetical protein